MKMNDKDVPNPGSDEAIELGCICPVIENARGKGAYGTWDGPDEEKLFWFDNRCPLHGDCNKETTNENQR